MDTTNFRKVLNDRIDELGAVLGDQDETMRKIAVDLVLDHLGAVINTMRCATTVIRSGSDAAVVREEIQRHLRERMRGDAELMVRLSYASVARTKDLERAFEDVLRQQLADEQPAPRRAANGKRASSRS